MAIAATIERYLAGQGISYEVVAHRHTGDSLHTAEAAHVSGESVAKAVVLKDEQRVRRGCAACDIQAEDRSCTPSPDVPT